MPQVRGVVQFLVSDSKQPPHPRPLSPKGERGERIRNLALSPLGEGEELIRDLAPSRMGKRGRLI
jgi:hypothetical protein